MFQEALTVVIKWLSLLQTNIVHSINVAELYSRLFGPESELVYLRAWGINKGDGLGFTLGRRGGSQHRPRK